MFFFQLCKALWQAAMSMLFSFFLNFQSIGQYGSLILINCTTVLQEKLFQLPIYVDVTKTIKNVQTDLVICSSFLFPIKYIQQETGNYHILLSQFHIYNIYYTVYRYNFFLFEQECKEIQHTMHHPLVTMQQQIIPIRVHHHHKGTHLNIQTQYHISRRQPSQWQEYISNRSHNVQIYIIKQLGIVCPSFCFI